MKRVVLDIVEVCVEMLTLAGLIFGNFPVRVICGFLKIGYKLVKTKLDLEKYQNKNNI